MSGERVVVVGAGPAGIRAAEVLAAAGVVATLIDENSVPGGAMYRPPDAGTDLATGALYGFEAGRARRLQATAAALSGRIDYRPATTAWNVVGKVLDARHKGVDERIPFAALILATGAVDLMLPFPGWDRPGVSTLGGALAALGRPGAAGLPRTVFLGTGPLLYLAAYRYLRAGAAVAAVLDTADPAGARRQLAGLLSGGLDFAKGLLVLSRLRAAKLPMLAGVRPVAVIGAERIEALRCRDAAGVEFQAPAEAVAIGFGRRSDCRLADRAGCAFAYDASLQQWLPVADADGLTSVPGIYVAGDGRREAGANAAEAAGALAAFAVLVELGYPITLGTLKFWQTRAGYGTNFHRALAAAFPPPMALAAEADDSTVVCRCEGTTAGALRRAARSHGIGGVAEARTVCRIGAGACQGRDCVFAADAVLAAALGVAAAALPRPRAEAKA